MTCESTTPIISPVKRGDTFMLACIYKQNGTAYDITSYTIQSQIRDSLGILVTELIVTKANQTINPGAFVLSITGVINWPIDILSCDIQFSDDQDIIRSSETFKIPVEEDITYD